MPAIRPDLEGRAIITDVLPRKACPCQAGSHIARLQTGRIARHQTGRIARHQTGRLAMPSASRAHFSGGEVQSGKLFRQIMKKLYWMADI